MNGKLLRWMLCLVLFIGLFSAAILKAQAPISVTGQVTGTAGDPKRFVTVKLDGPASYIALTDEEGRFALSGLIPGQYAVTVRQEEKVQKFSLKIQSDTLNLVVKW
jgi:protocatechuate 3,4-dioxygenase beta subunit